LEKLKQLKERSFKLTDEIQTASVSNLIADLHVELIYLFHKISIRLLDIRDSRQLTSDKDVSANFEKDYQALMADCKKNKISQALLMLAKASFLSSRVFLDPPRIQADQKTLVEKAYEKLLKAQDEDRMLYEKHVIVDAKVVVKSKIPPAPIVCLRTQNKIVVQPRNFEALDGTKPAWYRIFASQSTSVNCKTRISDYSFLGCGEQVNIR
jgi:hypothetical protein